VGAACGFDHAESFSPCCPGTDDPAPQKILGNFKAYGSRALNHRFGKPPSETWWTTNGSKRKLKDDFALANAINYVLHKQPHPMVVWQAGEPGA
jgi:hypothetical protein